MFSAAGLSLIAPLIVADLVALWLVAGIDSTRVTVMLSLLGILTGCLAWIAKRASDTAQMRAQVLIQEFLATGPRTRSEIRTHIYGENLFFRLSRSTYVDALGTLLSQGLVRVAAGKQYCLTSHYTKQEALENSEEMRQAEGEKR